MSNLTIVIITGLLSGCAVGSGVALIKKIRKDQKKEHLLVQKELDKFKFDPRDAELEHFIEDIHEVPPPTFEETMAETEHPEDDPDYEDEDLLIDEEDEEAEEDDEDILAGDEEDEVNQEAFEQDYAQARRGYSGTGEPYLIQEESYFRMHDGYDKIELTWSEDEQLLRDNEDDTVLDISKFIGYDSLDHFGDYSDPNCIYVRNERMRIDFEVTRE